ncbi:odorant receptor 13a-like isoform X2 [Venturia canescens]|uniref:odorant receptor 13a-like isoform X2 n=1 Tax=Venturia canescens TaxID=32260 RepID=UPI001C9BEF17|nr:odorant receptor 13a-like isoform X2 [Venturia canescens]
MREDSLEHRAGTFPSLSQWWDFSRAGIAMDRNQTASHRQILDANVSALRFFGFWAPGPGSPRLWKLLYPFYNKIMLALMCSFAATIVADLCTNYGDLMILTDDGCFIAGVSVVIFKLFNFQARRERIDRLMSAIHEPVEILRRSSDEAVVRLVKSFVLHEKTTVYFLSSLGGFLVLALLLFVPTENGSLPIRAKYPFDSRVKPMHEIAFFIQASAVTTTIVAIMAMDTIVIGFCRFTHLQLQVLTSNYLKCRNSSSERGSLELRKGHSATSFFRPQEDFVIRTFVPFHLGEINETEDSFTKRFKTCVKHHQRLFEIVDDINELFGSSMLVQLCASSSMICLTGFQAVLGAKESANFMKFALYLGAAFSQLLCWCWFGNKLIYQSDSLALSQWFSGWEDETNYSSLAALIVVSLIRTRRPMSLTAGSFYTMSMETFIAILKSSYSFFALLTTVNEET